MLNEMKSTFGGNKIIILLIGILALIQAIPALAKNPKSPADYNGLNKKNKNAKKQLYLYEKIKVEGSWEIVENGAWGKMTYDLSEDELSYVFNGHGLNKGEKYTLIYYPDPWPGNNLRCLGVETSNNGGNVHIAGTNTGDLPIEEDKNHPNGAKIWLVLSGDVDCADETRMTRWNPEEYLFEYNLI